MPRKDGELPRKSFCLDSREAIENRKLPAQSVEIILYSKEALAEGGEEAEFGWNIISINASPSKEKTPQNPTTLMANHFHDDGGTNTGMDDTTFVDTLREAYFFWKDKTFIG